MLFNRHFEAFGQILDLYMPKVRKTLVLHEHRIWYPSIEVVLFSTYMHMLVFLPCSDYFHRSIE